MTRQQNDNWPPLPAPVAGCATCQALQRRRAEARAAGDRSGVSDANVLLRKHAAQQHP